MLIVPLAYCQEGTSGLMTFSVLCFPVVIKRENDGQEWTLCVVINGNRIPIVRPTRYYVLAMGYRSIKKDGYVLIGRSFFDSHKIAKLPKFG
jgi:hypothetical protein